MPTESILTRFDEEFITSTKRLPINVTRAESERIKSFLQEEGRKLIEELEGERLGTTETGVAAKFYDEGLQNAISILQSAFELNQKQ